jgi:NADH:ubiquinone oxidoreductase subunit C
MKEEPEIKKTTALQIFHHALKVKLKKGDLLAIAAAQEKEDIIINYYFHTEEEQLVFQVKPLEERISSLYLLFPTADYSEREIYAQWGIKFIGNPNLAIGDKP